MCRQNSPVHHAGEEEIAADESLLIYCKPVELYNILYRRALQNAPKECTSLKGQHLNQQEVLAPAGPPFVTEDYQAVNVSVKINILRSEVRTFSRPRKRRRKDSVQNEKCTNVKFLELDSPEGIHNGFLEKDDDDILSCKGENVSRTSRSEKILSRERNDGGKFGPDHSCTMDDLEHVESSFNIPGVSIAMPQSSVDPECSKSICKSDPALPAKTKKLSMDRSDSRKYVHKTFLLIFDF
ncbi:hypothetical protein JHK84_030208 [Glycine max]|nr:hypothetical protein JHK84_030208 [Glycine max]